ncbi:hypothetical protein FIV42_00590 [Persicimonas caeni]|uniref:Uncharacterized protein n=1 Tax=Persicimonas caeni TaxID=2292766 RepID=A0A4Y6PLZ4_PERCE|nr:hypothetical protein [Persicimonas caeni]QDG49282.1 hypothetical protein FIV42_00590 [Persicimonas caeni]QED30503.1 hypothetical protein FRD00_00585 [Persicimonas caeni]
MAFDKHTVQVKGSRILRCEKIRHVETVNGSQKDHFSESVGEVDCGTEPAGDLYLVVKSGGTSHRFLGTLDEDGEALFGFQKFGEDEFPIDSVFASVECRGESSCSPASVKLPAETAANLARFRGTPSAYEQWLRTYPDHELAANVRTGLSEAKEKALEKANEKMTDATAHLSAGRYVKAYRAIRDCQEKKPGHEGCTELEGKLDAALASVRPARVKHFATTRDASGYEMYFSLVDDDGEFVKVPGRVEFGLEVYGRYHAIARKWVREGDYKAGRVGLRREKTVAFLTHVPFGKFYYNLPFMGAEQAREVKYGGRVGPMRLLVTFKALTGEKIQGQAEFSP